MLLQDEKNVIQWLTQYGALPRSQVMRLLYDKPQRTADKIIRNLIKQLRISEVSSGYYLGLDNMCKPDQRIILAVWVLLRFINQIESMAHYPATYPSQIFFLKKNVGYEIVVLYDGEQHLARLLQPEEDLKYIFVVPHISMEREIKLPNTPCLFATVDYTGKDEPDIKFYSEGEEQNESK